MEKRVEMKKKSKIGSQALKILVGIGAVILFHHFKERKDRRGKNEEGD